jgi:GNAT superfamily N-acetyltransferase
MTATKLHSPFALRPFRPDDVEPLARICFDAFCDINRRHGFPPDFPSTDVARGLFGMMAGSDRVHGVVADQSGRAIGSAFAWSGNGGIVGIGPVTVDPAAQASGVGRAMMQSMLDRARERRAAGVRLVQAAFNTTSMSLYTKLGFDAREPLLCLNGPKIDVKIADVAVRPATVEDLDACASLCRDVHGHDRTDDLREAIAQGWARVATRGRDVVAYCTDVGFFGHAVARSLRDLTALIAAAERITGPGLLVPSRHAELLRWCLAHGLRIVHPMTLMSIGLYNEPNGAWWPSILF